jgi:hypothetical protein
LILNVAANHTLFCPTNTLHKVPIAPKTIAPQKLLKLRKLQTQQAAGSSLEDVDNFGYRHRRRYLQKQVKMIGLDIEFMQRPVSHFTPLAQQRFDTLCDFPLQHTTTILGSPNQMYA